MFQCDINVTSGIRQGCNASSNLFLLITYCIIEKLYAGFILLQAYKKLSPFMTILAKKIMTFL